MRLIQVHSICAVMTLTQYPGQVVRREGRIASPYCRDRLSGEDEEARRGTTMMVGRLKQAFAQADQLSPEEQEVPAELLLQEMNATERWNARFADPRSDVLLDRLVAEALAEDSSTTRVLLRKMLANGEVSCDGNHRYYAAAHSAFGAPMSSNGINGINGVNGATPRRAAGAT